jgi:glutathione peroxidase
MKRTLSVILIMLGCIAAQAQDGFYALKATTLQGEEYSFEQLRGKYVLIVNTASKCGFTKQYADLQRLWETYGDKIVVLGFPCNQFGEQEKGSNAEIGTFCKANYGVTFPMMSKSDVKGKNQNPVYKWLTDKAENGWNTKEPTWNFCKYIINPQGYLLNFFPSKIEPLGEEIVKIIAPPAPEHREESDICED